MSVSKCACVCVYPFGFCLCLDLLASVVLCFVTGGSGLLGGHGRC